jgi:hypothetical protein
VLSSNNASLCRRSSCFQICLSVRAPWVSLARSHSSRSAVLFGLSFGLVSCVLCFRTSNSRSRPRKASILALVEDGDLAELTGFLG